MKTLNSEQEAVIQSKAAQRVVLAGAGSGKTATLTEAVFQDCHTYGAAHVIAITFTNAGADELTKRLKARGVTSLGFCGTLHAFLLKLLQQHGTLVGLPETLSVMDAEQVEPSVEAIMERMGVKVPLSKVMPIIADRSLVFNGPPRSYTKEQLVAKEYHASNRRNGLLDFDEILIYGHALMVMFRGDKTGWPYHCCYVDEVQDSSEMDWLIYRAMACERKFMVGDDSQAIYSFRGGDMRQLIVATQSSDWTAFKLETNYRSGSRICEAANRLISHNKDRVDKKTVAVREGGEVTMTACETPAAEMCFVLDTIQKSYNAPCMCGDDRKGSCHGTEHPYTPMDKSGGNPEWYPETAVLCRTNRQVQELSEFIAARGIPVAKRQQAAEPQDWKRAKALLTVLANPFNDFAVEQYVRMTKGAGALAGWKQKAQEQMKSLNEIYAFAFGHGGHPGTGLAADLTIHGLSLDSRERILAAAGVLDARSPGWTLPELLIYLRSDGPQEEAGAGVTVCTIHAAKGREFDVVFLCGCEEGTLPSAKSIKAGGAAVDEERRLAYVAVTRARDKVFLSWRRAVPQSRGPNIPAGPPVQREPSRFLKEMGVA